MIWKKQESDLPLCTVLSLSLHPTSSARISSPFLISSSLLSSSAAALTASPFALATERRGAAHRAELARRLEQQAAEAKLKAEFHARPVIGNPDLMVELRCVHGFKSSLI
jgi:hypothetical protein